MARMTYREQLLQPAWQKRRLERLAASQWSCENCGDDKLTLHVHHKRYVKGRMVWEYSDEELSVLCATCHEQHHIHERVLDELLMHIPIEDVVSLIGGYLHDESDVDPALLESARQTYPPSYALGFLAKIHGYKDLNYAHEICKNSLKLVNPKLEIHEVFKHSDRIFGKA